MTCWVPFAATAYVAKELNAVLDLGQAAGPVQLTHSDGLARVHLALVNPLLQTAQVERLQRHRMAGGGMRN